MNKNIYLKIIDSLDKIYGINDQNKQELYNALNATSEENLKEIITSITEFLKEQKESLDKLNHKIDKTSLQIEEIKEKKEFFQTEQDFFNEI